MNNNINLKQMLDERERYPNFTFGIMKALKTDEMKNKMHKYLVSHPEANDEDIIQKTAELRGVSHK